MGDVSTAGATISDVAAAAGVSRATVSRVMNGHRVDPELAERVRRAATSLDYRPSALARSLSLGRTHTVGVIVPDLTNPMFQEVLRGVARGADAAGYGVVVAETQERAEREAAAVRSTRARVDAMVLVAPRASEAELSAMVASARPVVLVNRLSSDDSTPSVGVDFAEAMFGAVEHLVDLGHGAIVYLAGPTRSASNAERVAGFETAQASFGGVSFISQPCGATIADGCAAAEAFMATRATAAVAYNDLVALGLQWRLRELGVGVPDQVSVVGFDDIELAQFGTPPLTTVSVPRTQIGERAWCRLHDQIEAEPDAAPAETDPEGADTSTELLGTRLIVRQSTGPAPGGSVSTGGARTEAATPTWRGDMAGAFLSSGPIRLACYRTGESLPQEQAPRPFLHPVRALSGARLTVAGPAASRHHRGVSLAFPDVNGWSFWGGRQPSAQYGRQVSGTGYATDADLPGVLTDQLDWIDPDGVALLQERRQLTARLVSGGWALHWASELGAVREVTLGGKLQHGGQRPRYGGIFWRFAAVDESVVATASGVGLAASAGSRSAWLSLALRTGRLWSTVVLIQRDGAPWDVRVGPYVAAGPAVTWDSSLQLHPGDRLTLSLTALILDGLHTPSAVAERWLPSL